MTTAAPATPRELDVAGEAPSGGTAGLAAWWTGLPPGRRQQLLGLGSGEPLPQAVVGDLRHHGVLCPLTLVPEGGRVVRRSLPPALLLDFLARERAGAAGPAPLD